MSVDAIRRHIKAKATLLQCLTLVRVTIVEQSHIMVQFNPLTFDHSFTHHGYTLCSWVVPRRISCDSCYVLGMWDKSRLLELGYADYFDLPLEEYKRFKAAVQAYNETFSGRRNTYHKPKVVTRVHDSVEVTYTKNKSAEKTLELWQQRGFNKSRWGR